MPIDPEVLKVLNMPLFESKDGDYAELQDEKQPEGIVNLKRKNGHVFAYMPREVWDDIQKGLE